MARPKKLTLDFFIHSASARHDRRIKSLRRREKNDGYATYYILLEMSCSEAEMKLHLDNEIIVEDIADECGLRDVPHLYKVIESCVSVGLFNPLLWKSERIVFSDDLYNSYLDRLEDRKATAERKQRYSEAKSLQDKIDKVTQENPVVTQENLIVTQENPVVTQYGTPEDQNYRTTEITEITEIQNAFFLTGENSSPEQKTDPLLDLSKPEDPKTPPLPPLSVAAQKLQEQFEGRFKNKPNRYAPQGLVEAGFGEWHLGEDYDNWRPSLIKVAQQVKRDLKQPCEIKDATKYLFNIARQSRIESHWGTFKGMTKDAIAIEQSQQQRSQQQPTPQLAPPEDNAVYTVPSFVKDFAKSRKVS